MSDHRCRFRCGWWWTTLTLAVGLFYTLAVDISIRQSWVQEWTEVLAQERVRTLAAVSQLLAVAVPTPPVLTAGGERRKWTRPIFSHPDIPTWRRAHAQELLEQAEAHRQAAYRVWCEAHPEFCKTLERAKEILAH